MKKLIALVLVVAVAGGAWWALRKPRVAVPGTVPGANGEWLDDIQKARALAREMDRPLLIFFTGSDWCLWCRRLHEETLSKPEFAAWAARHLVLMKADFPRKTAVPEALKKQNLALVDEYKTESRFPTLVALDPSGKELGRMGYFPGGPELFIPQLQNAMDPDPDHKTH